MRSKSLIFLLFSLPLWASSLVIELHHEELRPEAMALAEYLKTEALSATLQEGSGTESENLALVALKVERLFAASLSLSTLRSIMPELKFITKELDETDIAIMEHSLHSAGLTLLGARKNGECLCFLVSGIRKESPLYEKLLRHIKKI